MSEADLIAVHDEIAIEAGSHSTTDDSRAELARRRIGQADEHDAVPTGAIAVPTLANVAFVAYSV